MGNPALILDAIVPDRPYVSIKSKLHKKGKPYEMRRAEQLSMEQLKTIEVRGKAAVALSARQEAGEELGIDDGQLLDAWTRELLAIVFHTPLEEAVYEDLTHQQRLQVIETFTRVCLNSPNGQTTTGKRRTGAK